MKTTMDRAGRLVVPKILRAAVGLENGGEVELTLREGHIEIEPPEVLMRLVEREGAFVIEGDEELPPLTTEEVRDIIERVRR